MPEGMLTGASCHQTHRDYGSDAPAVNSASTTLMLKRLERGGAPSASALSAPVDVDAILTDSKKHGLVVIPTISRGKPSNSNSNRIGK
jgi:hypothetical protein